MEKGSKGLEGGGLRSTQLRRYLEHDSCTPLDNFGGVLILRSESPISGIGWVQRKNSGRRGRVRGEMVVGKKRGAINLHQTIKKEAVNTRTTSRANG
jgi:hypothetical protein